MTKLSKDEKKEAEELLTNYKSAYACKKCGRIYGSDLTPEHESGVCIVCVPQHFNNSRSKK